MFNIFKTILPIKRFKSSEVATRQEMLRHTEFFQFSRQIFGKESSPHELHWALRDALLDSGAKVLAESHPLPIAHWSMTQPEMVGNNTGCESDYMPFSGSIRSEKGRSLDKKKFFLLCLLFVFPGIIYYFWSKKYHNGRILTRYEGVYRRPESGATNESGVKNWEFQVDIMFSYLVEVPPFGLKSIGPEIVQPTFKLAIGSVLEFSKTGSMNNRYLPKLVSRFSKDYENRFPVKSERSNPSYDTIPETDFSE